MTKKIVKAEKILRREKDFLLETLLEKNNEEFQSDKTFFSLYEEQAKYEIKNLKLKKEQEKHYINKIVEIYGEYSEDQPSNKPGEQFYSEFYFKKIKKLKK